MLAALSCRIHSFGSSSRLTIPFNHSFNHIQPTRALRKNQRMRLASLDVITKKSASRPTRHPVPFDHILLRQHSPHKSQLLQSYFVNSITPAASRRQNISLNDDKNSTETTWKPQVSRRWKDYSSRTHLNAHIIRFFSYKPLRRSKDLRFVEGVSR